MKELKTARMEVSRNGEFVPIELFGTQGSDYNKELQAAKTEAFLLENRLRSLYSAADEIIYSTKADVKRYRDTVAEHASHTADDVWACTKMRDDAKTYAEDAQSSYTLIINALEEAGSLSTMSQDIKTLQEKVGNLEATYQNFEDRIKTLEDKIQVIPEAKDSYTVTFLANNDAATGEMLSQTILKAVPTRLNANEYALAGHTFAGWANAATGSVVYMDRAQVLDLVGVGETKILYGVWWYNIPNIEGGVVFAESRASGPPSSQGESPDSPTVVDKFVTWTTPEIATSKTLEFNWSSADSGAEYGWVKGGYSLYVDDMNTPVINKCLYTEGGQSSTEKINITAYTSSTMKLRFWAEAQSDSSYTGWSARSRLKVSQIRMCQ